MGHVSEKVLAGIVLAVMLIFIAWTYGMSVSNYILSTNAVSDVPMPNSYSEPPENKHTSEKIVK